MKLYECGICDHLHPWDFHGDCRDDANRYTYEETQDGDCEVVPWEERLAADAPDFNGVQP